MNGLFRAAGISAIVIASAATGMTAANAAPACPTGKVCLYDNYWFTSYERQFGWVVNNIGDAANDKASSLVVGSPANPASPYVYFYENDYRNGHNVVFRGPGAHNDLRGIGMTTNRNWDDEITSIWG